MTINDLDKRVKLTSLWVFVFLNMIFRDLHEFGRAGFLEDMMTGVVNGVQITDGLMLVGVIMIAVPLLVIPLMQFLNVKGCRRINILMGGISVVSIIAVNRSPDLDDVFFAVIELLALLLIIRLAWCWTEDANGPETSGRVASRPS